MKLCKLGFYIILLGLASCKGPEVKFFQQKSDTAKVLELAIRTAFYHQNLPDLASLKKPYHFKDSILFTSDSLALSNLPQTIDSIKFKILPKNQIFSLIQTESDLNKLPNYLYVGAFERNDTGFYVNLKSLGCLPFSGGGSIGIYIKKENDSIVVKSISSSSIN
jgi:hypothetical protein